MMKADLETILDEGYSPHMNVRVRSEREQHVLAALTDHCGSPKKALRVMQTGALIALGFDIDQLVDDKYIGYSTQRAHIKIWESIGLGYTDLQSGVVFRQSVGVRPKISVMSGPVELAPELIEGIA